MSTRRQNTVPMTKQKEATPRTDRQIVGFSLPTKLAADVKMEAARRNVSLRNLFVEMWALYNSHAAKSEGKKEPRS